jgi:pimeloyl-ACP methyl ester carboxylesterase
MNDDDRVESTDCRALVRVETGDSPVWSNPKPTRQPHRFFATCCRYLQVAALTALIVATSYLATAQNAPTWHYDLRPGDHLVYAYSFHKQLESKDEKTQVEARFRTHVLVAAEIPGGFSLGFQRNREAEDLTQYVSKGKDKLAHEQIDFQKQMQTRPPHFSEAIEVSPSGEPRNALEVAREVHSHIIDALHEVLALPPTSLTRGATWHGGNSFGFDVRWIDDEPIHGKSCHHLEATSPKGSLKLDYWLSPDSGVLEQVALDGTYSDYDTTVHETARMELESRHRSESLETWLGSTETRLAALQAILLTPEVSVTAPQLTPPLSSNNAAAQSLALAIVARRKLDLPPDALVHLRQSPSELIREQVRQLTDLAATPVNSGAATDECHRVLPPKFPSPTLGTTFQIAAATKDIPGVPYILRVPLSYREDRPAPLLVYLSGGAGFALDAMNTAEDVVSQTKYLVLYPQAAAYWWTPETARRFDIVLNDVLQHYNVDRDRVYVTGFSNGGTGALYYATLWPQRFAAVVTQMGAGQCNEQVKAGLANLRNIPLLLIHGANEPVITPDCSSTTQQSLIDLHPATEPVLKILPSHAHDITLDSDDGLTLDFFKDKIRNPLPRIVDLTETDALASRAYWVEIVDGKPGKSDLDARVKGDNTIDIHSHEIKRIRLHLRPELFSKPGNIRIVWNGKKLFTGALRDACSLPSPVSTADPKLDLTDIRDLALP